MTWGQALAERYIDFLLSRVAEKGIIERPSYDKGEFAAARARIRRAFAGHKTSVHPMEERLLYALAASARPQSIVGVGSYNGYAMAWIVQNMGSKGQAILIDPDKEACLSCRRAFERAGLERTDVRADDFFDVYGELPRADFIWIDAYGARSNPFDRRGKRIYGEIVRAIEEKTIPGGILAAHNVRNVLPLGSLSTTGGFKPYLEERFRSVSYLPTPNGLAVARK